MSGGPFPSGSRREFYLLSVSQSVVKCVFKGAMFDSRPDLRLLWKIWLFSVTLRLGIRGGQVSWGVGRHRRKRQKEVILPSLYQTPPENKLLSLAIDFEKERTGNLGDFFYRCL
jgi:hypothetical protein